MLAEAGGGGAKTGLYQVACAMRGRNPSNPSSRIAGEHTEQRLEVGGEIANTITAVGKDSMVIDIYNKSIRTDGLAGTLTTGTAHNGSGTFAVEQSRRIRKLTPLETNRLMGFSDSDFEKCKDASISDSQLYKQHGNSIVVSVLMAIFGQLYGVPWQEKVYGAWWRPPNERMNDLPLFQTTKGGTYGQKAVE